MSEKQELRLAKLNQIAYVGAWGLLLIVFAAFITTLFSRYHFTYKIDMPQQGSLYFYWGLANNIFAWLVLVTPFIAFLYFFTHWLIIKNREGVNSKGILGLALFLFFLCCSIWNIQIRFQGGIHQNSVDFEQHRYHLSYHTTGWCCGNYPIAFTVWKCDRFGLMCEGSKVEWQFYQDYRGVIPALVVDNTTQNLYLDFNGQRVLFKEHLDK